MDPRYVKRQSAMVEQVGDPPPRLLNAPTLYCVFILGVAMICVGTFLTALAFIETHYDQVENSDEEASTGLKILKIVGPILIGIGILCLFGMSILCLVAYRSNKEQMMKSLLISTNNGSTFYRTSDLGPNDELNRVSTSQSGVDNPAIGGNVDSTQEPYRFLAKTVAMERTKNLSKKYKQNANDPSITETSFATHKISPLSPSHHSDYDGIDRNEDVMRDRAFTVSSRPQFVPREGLMRRHGSLTQSRREQQKEELSRKKVLIKMGAINQLNEYPSELDEAFGDFGGSQKRKESVAAVDSQLYQLPSCSPEIIESMLGFTPPIGDDFRRSASFEETPPTLINASGSMGQPWLTPNQQISTLDRNKRNKLLDRNISAGDNQGFGKADESTTNSSIKIRQRMNMGISSLDRVANTHQPQSTNTTTCPTTVQEMPRRNSSRKTRKSTKTKRLRKKHERPDKESRSQDSSSIPSSSRSSSPHDEESAFERRPSGGNIETLKPPSAMMAIGDASGILGNLLATSNTSIEKSGMQREHRVLSIIHSDVE